MLGIGVRQPEIYYSYTPRNTIFWHWNKENLVEDERMWVLERQVERVDQWEKGTLEKERREEEKREEMKRNEKIGQERIASWRGREQETENGIENKEKMKMRNERTKAHENIVRNGQNENRTDDITLPSHNNNEQSVNWGLLLCFLVVLTKSVNNILNIGIL